MKTIVGIIFFVTAALLGLVAVISSKNKNSYDRWLRGAIIIGIVAIFANITMLSQELTVSMVGASVFYCSLDFLLICFLEYVYSYTELSRHFRRGRLHLLLFIAFFDAVSLLSNVKTGWAFSYRESLMEDGSILYRYTALAPAKFHLLFCYILVIWASVILLYKTTKVASYYRRKYIMILVVFLVAVGMDGIYVLTDTSIDIGVLTYAVASILIYYYTTVFAPKEILNETIKSLVEELVDSVLVFDVNDRCVYINSAGRDFLGENCMKDAVWAIQGFRQAFPQEKYGVFEIEQQIKRNEREYFLFLIYQQIVDKKGKYAGCSVRLVDQTEQKRIAYEEHFKATHDYLTGIYNKEYFFTKVQKRLEENPYTKYCMVVSDIDNFKLVNDVFGQTTGNLILEQIAKEIEARIMPEDLYGRLDGDKFVIMMPREKFREDYFIRETDLKVDVAKLSNFPLNIYLGVYDIVTREIEVSAMCDRALLAINSIKGSLNKRIAYYDDSIRDNLIRERELVSEMEPALENHEFVLFLQPQVDETGKVLGAEALVRWQHPKRGLLFPGDFIEVFEQKGIITKLDEYVWECACEKLAMWKKRGREDLYISVNISARDMYSLNIYHVFTSLVKKYEIDPGTLHLEITETAVMINLEKQLELIHNLRKFGFEVEMDDFGSGYSSLNMLKDMNLDVLKIDMRFLGRSGDLHKGRRILNAVVAMADDIGMRSIVEGVETEEELEFLKGISCKIFQGYYFAKPMPIPDFEEKYMM